MEDKECIGIGDIEMSDLMNMTDTKAVSMFRSRFKAYRALADQIGEDAAFEKMMKGYPEQQKAFMGAFIEGTTMARGFTDAKPVFRLMGFDMEVLDISEEGKDAVLEIQRVCPVLSLSKEYGLETPCRVLCEMEQEAVRRAFPNMQASILSSKARGDCVCVFKYERPATTAMVQRQNQSPRILDLIKLLPKFFRIGLNVLKGRFASQKP